MAQQMDYRNLTLLAAEMWYAVSGVRALFVELYGSILATVSAGSDVSIELKW